MGLSQADYAAQIVQLLPRGKAWQGELLQQLVQAFAAECARVDAQGVVLVTEAFPQTTNQCLPDWERVAGIPSAVWPAVVPSSNISQRQRNLVAKLSAQGGQSIPYLISVATLMGYTISSITDCYSPFTCKSNCNDLLYGEAWAFTFTVNVSALPAGETVAFDGSLPMLRQYSNARIEAVINSLQPAQTVSLFTYPG